MKNTSPLFVLVVLYFSALFSFSSAVQYIHNDCEQPEEVVSSIAYANNHEFIFPNIDNYTYLDQGTDLLKNFSGHLIVFSNSSALYFKTFLFKVAPRSLIANLFVFYHNLRL